MHCQVLVPVVFFGIMCIPKHYIKPQPRPREIISRAYDLDMGLTSNPGSAEYFGGHLLEFAMSEQDRHGAEAVASHLAVLSSSTGHGDSQTQQLTSSTVAAGPARFTQNISLLYAPNNAAAGAVMQRFAQVSMLTHSQPLNAFSVSCTCRRINALTARTPIAH